MPKHRLNRISEEVKKEISDIVRNELNDPRISTMCSIISVDVTPDLRFAKAYVSVLGSEQEKNDTIKGLNNAAGFVRKEVGSRINLRYTPEIIFELDKSIEYGSNIIKIINDLKEKDGGESF